MNALRKTALLTLLLASIGPLRAASIPDWAQAIADQAPPIPAGVSEFSERVLFKEEVVEFLADGTTRSTLHFVAQALTQTSPTVGIRSASQGGGFTTEKIQAWHLPPPGKGKVEHRGARDAVDFAAGDAFFSDEQGRLVGFGNLLRGSLFIFESVSSGKGLTAGGISQFGDVVPVDRERLIVRVPPQWRIAWGWVGGAGFDPVGDNTSLSWERAQETANSVEPMGPDFRDRSATLLYAAVPPTPVAELMADQDWGAFSSDYRRRIEASGVAEAVREAAIKAAGGATEFFDKVNRIALEVRDQVRYLSQLFGNNGFIPRPPTETLATQWGDCKDKATLFRAMLGAVGIESHPVLIRMYGSRSAIDKVVYPNFDHFITAVVVPGDIELPERARSAYLADPVLGRLLFVDVTDENSSIGWIDPTISGEKALVVAPHDGHLVTTPGWSPGSHRREVAIELTLRSSGAADYSVKTRRTGRFAASTRALLRRSASQREAELGQLLLAVWPRVDVGRLKYELETATGETVEEVNWRVADPPFVEAERRIALFPLGRSGLICTPLSHRKTAVVYPHPMTLITDTVTHGVSATARVPEPLERSGTGWSVKTGYDRVGTELHARLEIVLEKTEYQTGDFGELENLCHVVAQGADAAIYLPEPAQ